MVREKLEEQSVHGAAGGVRTAVVVAFVLTAVFVLGLWAGPSSGPRRMSLGHVVRVAGTGRAAGMAMDFRGVLYVADVEGEVRCILPDGGRAVLCAGIADPGGLAVDGRRRVYVSSGADGAVYRITPDGRRETVLSGVSKPSALALDRDGSLYLCVSGGVFRIPREQLESGAVEAGLF